MKQFLINPKLKNPYFWLSLVGLFFAAAGIDFNTLTNWNLLWGAVLTIIDNPVSIVSVITCLVGIWNDNDTPGLDGIKTKNEDTRTLKF